MIQASNGTTGILDRLARIEERTALKFAEMEKALVLARDLVKTESESSRLLIDTRLHHVNELQQKMNKLETTFVTRPEHDAFGKLIAANSRFIYIGVGAVLVFEIIIKYVK